jgi:hypothetical protein
VPIVIVGEPIEAARVYNTLTPQQHSHSREKVLVNSLLRAKKVLVDCKGLESALEAARVSVEAVRVSIEALRCLRGCERLEEVPENVSRGRESVAEAKKVPVEVVRKSVLQNSGTHQNVLVLFQSF